MSEQPPDEGSHDERPPQFGMKTLLAGTAVVAGGLGWYLWANRKDRVKEFKIHKMGEIQRAMQGHSFELSRLSHQLEHLAEDLKKADLHPPDVIETSDFQRVLETCVRAQWQEYVDGGTIFDRQTTPGGRRYEKYMARGWKEVLEGSTAVGYGSFTLEDFIGEEIVKGVAKQKVHALWQKVKASNPTQARDQSFAEECMKEIEIHLQVGGFGTIEDAGILLTEVQDILKPHIDHLWKSAQGNSEAAPDHIHTATVLLKAAKIDRSDMTPDREFYSLVGKVARTELEEAFRVTDIHAGVGWEEELEKIQSMIESWDVHFDDLGIDRKAIAVMLKRYPRILPEKAQEILQWFDGRSKGADRKKKVEVLQKHDSGVSLITGTNCIIPQRIDEEVELLETQDCGKTPGNGLFDGRPTAEELALLERQDCGVEQGGAARQIIEAIRENVVVRLVARLLPLKIILSLARTLVRSQGY